MKRKFIVVDYFDVWGNEKDGYEVNNLCALKSTIELDDNSSGGDLRLEIQNELKLIDYWKRSVNRRQWRIDQNCFDMQMIEIEAPDGRPLCRLESR